MLKILIIGANSAIAEATARRWASDGAAFYLVARDEQKLAAVAADLLVRGAQTAETAQLDVNQIGRHHEVLSHAFTDLEVIDVVLLAHGTLPTQIECDESVARTMEEFATNGVSTIALMTSLAKLLETQRTGTLAVVSSVAGDRGRASNAIYGAAKSAVTAYASALGQRLRRAGVHVLTIKPGLVHSPMTSALAKGPLWSKPERIANGIVRAVAKKRFTVYLPWFWRPIMTVIRLLPEVIFRRMKF